MIWITCILFLSLICFAMTAGMFLRIRQDVDFLRQEKEEHIDLVQKFMQSVVSHEDMTKYLEKIQEECKQLNILKDKYAKEKWSSFQKAFGGKEEDKD